MEMKFLVIMAEEAIFLKKSILCIGELSMLIFNERFSMFNTGFSLNHLGKIDSKNL